MMTNAMPRSALSARMRAEISPDQHRVDAGEGFVEQDAASARTISMRAEFEELLLAAGQRAGGLASATPARLRNWSQASARSRRARSSRATRPQPTNTRT